MFNKAVVWFVKEFLIALVALLIVAVLRFVGRTLVAIWTRFRTRKTEVVTEAVA